MKHLLSIVIAALMITMMYVPPVKALTFTDNFDDNSINLYWWTPITGSSTVAENNNRIEMTQGAQEGAALYFNFAIPGNFTMQASYSLLNWPADNQERIAIGGDFGAVERISDEPYGPGSEFYLTHFRQIGDSVKGVTQTSDRAGMLKFSKVNSTYSGYYWKGSEWLLINSYAFNGSRPVENVSLNIWADYGFNPGVKIAFDNFYLDAPNLQINNVPEPGTMLLLSSIIFGIGCFKRKID